MVTSSRRACCEHVCSGAGGAAPEASRLRLKLGPAKSAGGCEPLGAANESNEGGGGAKRRRSSGPRRRSVGRSRHSSLQASTTTGSSLTKRPPGADCWGLVSAMGTDPSWGRRRRHVSRLLRSKSPRSTGRRPIRLLQHWLGDVVVALMERFGFVLH